ncbi:MAG: hypothetical protein KKA67_16005 [Spirochaetes bacterium]|nr:hypothetical protein [Spirochaetota bacterium]MBU1079132.1 hypothetical protein [Spirochaetota bacterium]
MSASIRRAASELCAALRIPSDGASYAALSAMIAERLPLDPSTALALRRAVRRHGDDPAAASVAARAASVGLDPGGEACERILGILDHDDTDGSGSAGGSFGSGDSSGGGTGDGEAAGRHGDGSGGRHGDESPPGAAADQSGILEIARSLEAAAAAAMGDPDATRLATPDPAGPYWACLPFKTEFRGVNYHGFFRLWYYSKGTKAGRLLADIRFGDQRRLLEVSGAGNGTRIAYYSGDEAERTAFEKEFSGYAGVASGDLEEGYLRELGSRKGVDEDA